MTQLPEFILSIKLIDNTLVFELETESDAELFQKIMEEDPKWKARNFERSERKGNVVILYFKSKEDAERRLLQLIPPDPNYLHPLETQGKRCRSCD